MNNRIIIVILSTLSLVLAGTLNSEAQLFRRAKKQENTAVADTAKSKKNDYGKLLEGASTDQGMFSVHRKGNDFYFEIPDSLMGRDILLVNKISGVPYALNDAGLNKGMEYSNKIIRFRKDTTYKKVWALTFDPRITSPAGDSITRSVRDNYRESVIEYFPIEAYGPDSTSVVIKVNKIFDGSEKSFNDFFNLILRSSTRKDLSKIESIRSFPANIVVKALYTTLHTEEGGSIPLSVNVTTNLVLLDKEPMKPRFADERVGFFTVGHLYYNDRQQKAEERELVTRWRLEPRSEDIERYKRGELVEPAKPIVFYIDPATPPVWVDYIKKGVFEWQEAFEAAGFKNAIIAKEVDPEKDKEFDIDDVRYSVITYAASELANAMGPSVVDPRSGEIIEADIIWWHNVMSVLHSWIRVQTGAVDPDARGNVLPTELMGNAVRFVSSHELGHSLGMKHNMGASYCVPVDSLRSKNYTDTHGTASSIMDYARFNYVAQPGDGVTQLTPRIGAYDRHAIRWAYRWLDTATPHEELSTLNAWIREAKNDPERWYGEQSREGIDPRSQSEDLGNDAVRASRYGIENLKRIVPHITDWTAEEGGLHFEAGRLLMATVFQWRMYADHVMTNVGGFYLNNVDKDDDTDRYIPVPADYQRQCVGYLIDEVFTLPDWLFGAKVWDRSYPYRNSPVGLIEQAPYNFARELQYGIYYELLRDERIVRMLEVEARHGRNNSYTPEQMLSDITRTVFGKTGTLTLYERMSQKNYVDALIVSSNITMVKTTKMGSTLTENQCICGLMHEFPEIDLEKTPRPEDLARQTADETGLHSSRYYDAMLRTTETTSAKRGEMRTILNLVRNRLGSGDQATRNHYKDLELRLKEALRML